MEYGWNMDGRKNMENMDKIKENRLQERDFYGVRRVGRNLVVELKEENELISTSSVGGGQRGDVKYVVNHQICEGKDHREQELEYSKLGKEKYHQKVSEELGVEGGKMVLLSTAANMRYAGWSKRHFKDFYVEAITTGGVESNATRAGDRGDWDEANGEVERVEDERDGVKSKGMAGGTINIIVCISCELTLGGLMRTAMMVTESKSSVLWELGVGSRSSRGLATGTGTDQFCIVSRKGGVVRNWTGGHSKIGQLIGEVVRESLREALCWQNGLDGASSRSLIKALGRFGLTEDFLKCELKKRLSRRSYELFEKNYKSVIFDPGVSCIGYALAGVLDRIEYGSIPEGFIREGVLDQCGLLSMSISNKRWLYHNFRRRVEEEGILGGGIYGGMGGVSMELMMGWIIESIKEGWEKKWV